MKLSKIEEYQEWERFPKIWLRASSEPLKSKIFRELTGGKYTFKAM